jgi:hypothetical protein
VSNFGPKTISSDWSASWCSSVLSGTILSIKSWPSPSACCLVLITQQPLIIMLLHCVVWAAERSILLIVFPCIQCLTNLLTPWSRVLLEKLPVNFAASQEFSRIYGTRKSLTVPTSAHHLSLSWANSIQSPRPRVLLGMLTVNFAASQEIPRIYGTRKSLTLPTSARHLSLSWALSEPARLSVSKNYIFLYRKRGLLDWVRI